MHKQLMKALPFAGARLTKLRFCGNGKDSEVMLEVEGGRKTVLPLDYAEMDLHLSGPVPIRTKGRGDTEIVIEIVPAPEQLVTIAEAAIAPPHLCKEWDDYFREYEETGNLHCAVALRLTLIAE